MVAAPVSLSDLVARAAAVAGPPFDMAVVQGLCPLVDRLLEARLSSEKTWSRYDWLDGVVAQLVERDEERLSIRGQVWVNAVRSEPCEVEIRLAPPCGMTVRLMQVGESSEAGARRGLVFQAGRTWRYVFSWNEAEAPA